MTHMVISTPPSFCPGCGKDLRPTWQDALSQADFLAHASHTCQTCGTHFQYVDESNIVKLARDAGGDME